MATPRGYVRLVAQIPRNRKIEKVEVLLRMTGPAVPAPPRPRYQTVDRPGRIGLTRFRGQDPYEVAIPVRLGGEYPRRSVENDVIALESLAEVQPGQVEPPVVEVDGSVPNPHSHIEWRLVDLGDPVMESLGSGARYSYATTIVLQQRTTDSLLAESLSKPGKGIANRRHRVTAGEDSLYDVALAEYRDPSKAADIARANPRNGLPMPLGTLLKPGTILRLP